MKKWKKKAFAAFLVVAVIAAMLPMTVFAAETVKLNIYRNGNTDTSYSSKNLESLEKGATLVMDEINNYYQSSYGFDFAGYFNDGGWNNFKAGKNPSGGSSFVINGWTNIYCMVFDKYPVYLNVYANGDTSKPVASKYLGNYVYGTSLAKIITDENLDQDGALSDFFTPSYAYSWDKQWGHEVQNIELGLEGRNINGWTNLCTMVNFDVTPISYDDNVKYIIEHYRAEDHVYPDEPTDVEFKIGKIGEKANAVAKTDGDYEDYCLQPKAPGYLDTADIVELKTPADIVVLKLFYDLKQGDVTISTSFKGIDKKDIPVKDIYFELKSKDKEVVEKIKLEDFAEKDGVYSIIIPEYIGTYTVTESGASVKGYTLTVKDEVEFDLTEDGKTVEFVNSYTKEAPKTGDDNNMILWVVMALAAVALAGTSIVVFTKKKSE